MERTSGIITLLALIAILTGGMRNGAENDTYRSHYLYRCNSFREAQDALLRTIAEGDPNDAAWKTNIRLSIEKTREAMKGFDLWMRYLDPLAYKQVNSPLPVEWETEVFEKFEKPYKRIGAGLTLASIALDEEHMEKDSLYELVARSQKATAAYTADTTLALLATPDHFFFCNRLFLLNLAAIYTTGFECPDTARVIPELRAMLGQVSGSYQAFNQSFDRTPLTPDYLAAFDRMRAFVTAQPTAYSRFDHFHFIRDHVNPLFGMNQEMVRSYHVRSTSNVDYALSTSTRSIFDKDLYLGQEPKGIFRRVKDAATLEKLRDLGRSLFFDPLLSGNDQRSCASCHRPDQYFTDTTVTTAERFDHQGQLARNTPSLVNDVYNHLLMVDGKHTTLQEQVVGVITSMQEMGGNEPDVVEKVMGCNEYKSAFEALLVQTPQLETVSMEHIASALTWYTSGFSHFRAPFDDAMDARATIDPAVEQGFNLFMSKAQCATCHFVPHFNGVKPPYVGSEFEVLGVPEDTAFTGLSDDKGRYDVNPAQETLHAFRTGSLRNIEHTAPYMHNGVFPDLEEVLDFYDQGGGAGKGLSVDNQTLSSDSLHLTVGEKALLLAFLRSLSESVTTDQPPGTLPRSRTKALNTRRPGGTY